MNMALLVATDLSYKLCAPVGGINVTGLNSTNTSTTSSPTPASFTGDAPLLTMGGTTYGMVVTVAVGLLGGVVVL